MTRFDEYGHYGEGNPPVGQGENSPVQSGKASAVGLTSEKCIEAAGVPSQPLSGHSETCRATRKST